MDKDAIAHNQLSLATGIAMVADKRGFVARRRMSCCHAARSCAGDRICLIMSFPLNKIVTRRTWKNAQRRNVGIPGTSRSKVFKSGPHLRKIS